MRLIAAALLLVASGLLSVGFAASANAEKRCHTETRTVPVPGGGTKTEVVEVCVDDGDPGSPGTGSSGCHANGEEIPCHIDGFTWFSSEYCYASDVSEMYPAEEFPAFWEGNTDGSVWACHGMGPDRIHVGSLHIFWMPGAPPVDGRAVAESAVDTLAFVRPTIRMAPQPPRMTYVGLETWLWMPERQWGELQTSVSVSSATVTVTATPVAAEWDLSEGSTTCTSTGRPWVRGMGSGESTDCSYTFQSVSDFEPNGRYEVTSTLAYEVAWTCSGNCVEPSGSLGEVTGPVSRASARVGERQSVVVR